MKDINKYNLDEWMFDYFEGNLKADESARLLDEVKGNSEYQKEFNCWKHAYLADNSPVVYPFAGKLKKKSFWERKGFYFAVSAAILSLFGLLTNMNYENDLKTERGDSDSNNHIHHSADRTVYDDQITTSQGELQRQLVSPEEKPVIETKKVNNYRVTIQEPGYPIVQPEEEEVVVKEEKITSTEVSFKDKTSFSNSKELNTVVRKDSSTINPDSLNKRKETQDQQDLKKKSAAKRKLSKKYNYRHKGSFKLVPGKTIKDVNSNF